jgi:MATE family multidrug resistance protein
MLLTFMHLLPRFLSESRTLAALALPIILSQVAYTLLGLIDTVMAGQAGAVEQAAVALGVAFWMPVFITLMSVVQAISPAVAHHFGSGDLAAVVQDSHEGIWLAGISSLLPIALMPAVAPVMAWAQIDPLLIGKTTLFLWGIMFGLPAALIFRAISFYSASINRPKPMMFLAFAGLGVNALFNWLLIWGHWGLPALGGAGCGWATAIGMWVALAALIAWTAWSPDYRACYLWRGWRLPHWPIQKRLLQMGLPMGGAALAEVSAFTSVAILVGRFGAEQIAAHQIALNISSVLFMLPMGLSAALTIRVGQQLGAGNPRAARRVAWTGVAMGLIAACVLMPLIVFGRESIVDVFSADPSVRQIATGLMLFAAFWQLADATQVLAIGALRGYQVTFGPMLVMFVAFWLIGLPLGVRLGYYGIGSAPAMAVYGFWIGLVTALVLAAIALSTWLRIVARQRL